jgi:hypothetical protein
MTHSVSIPTREEEQLKTQALKKAHEIANAQGGGKLLALLAYGSRISGKPRSGSDIDLLIVLDDDTSELPPSRLSIYRGTMQFQSEKIPVEARFYTKQTLFSPAEREKMPPFFWNIFADAKILWADDSQKIQQVQDIFKNSCEKYVEDQLQYWSRARFEQEMGLFLWEHHEMMDIVTHAAHHSPLAAMARFADMIQWYCLDSLRLKCMLEVDKKGPQSEALEGAHAYFKAQCLKLERFLDPDRYPIHGFLTSILLPINAILKSSVLDSQTLLLIRTHLEQCFRQTFGRELYPENLPEVHIHH